MMAFIKLKNEEIYCDDILKAAKNLKLAVEKHDYPGHWHKRVEQQNESGHPDHQQKSNFSVRYELGNISVGG